MLGAIRSLIGENRQVKGETVPVNWEKYLKDEQYQALRQEIGGDDDFGQLRLKGPFLIYQEERLYPVPLSLMQNGAFCHLQIGQPVHCDLGQQVRLPKLLQADRGAKPLNQAWLTEAGLIKVLNGQLPEQSEVIPHNQLFHLESRLGIVRDRERRATKEGLLYQAQHLRFKKEISQVKDNLTQAIEKLNGYQIGNETALGRGELIAGIWKSEQER